MDILLRPQYIYLQYGPRALADGSALPSLTFLDRVKMNPETLFESCLFRGVFSGIAGFGLGLLFGGFFHTMSIEATLQTQTLPFMQQVKESYKGFGAACLRSAKGFGKIGMLYSTVECFIERERATQDTMNAVYGGCVTGAALAWQAGPSGMALGCAGFAAFSGIIEKVTHSS
jgi:mitochondrial import inner membrane translocase subunit TIM22